MNQVQAEQAIRACKAFPLAKLWPNRISLHMAVQDLADDLEDSLVTTSRLLVPEATQILREVLLDNVITLAEMGLWRAQSMIDEGWLNPSQIEALQGPYPELAEVPGIREVLRKIGHSDMDACFHREDHSRLIEIQQCFDEDVGPVCVFRIPVGLPMACLGSILHFGTSSYDRGLADGRAQVQREVRHALGLQA